MVAKERPQISIIMPCYNTEQNVAESVLSILNNRIAQKCELIIINDGSTDNSENIINNVIKEKGNFIIKYKKINNSGVSVARNTGFEMAEGDYIVFIDSDDKQSPIMLEALLKGILQFHADIGFCQWTNDKKKIDTSFKKAKLMKTLSFLKILLYRTKPIGLWTVMFKKSLLDSNKIKFSKDIKYGEDLQFLWKAAIRARNVAEIDAKYYYYRPSPTSAMKKTTWRKTEVINVMSEMKKEIEHNVPSFADEFESFMIPRTLLSLLKDFAQTDSKDYYDKLRKEYDCRRMMSTIKHSSIKIRGSAYLYCISPFLFYQLFKRLT